MPRHTTVHLDAAYDATPTRDLLIRARIPRRDRLQGRARPHRASRRWVIEWTNSCMNGYGKRRRCTDGNAVIADFKPLPRRRPHHLRKLIQRAAMGTAGTPDQPPTTQVISIAGRPNTPAGDRDLQLCCMPAGNP